MAKELAAAKEQHNKDSAGFEQLRAKVAELSGRVEQAATQLKQQAGGRKMARRLAAAA